ncbi:hypothetical protein SeMB42_g05724 [Synchytrium endobioticum]|uniref:Gelsolin-like domain-containing protein n=1 Tax=Synchytrium endobioticum TaxID=286115 RepID=A0A507CPP6_9FUNG|nr:hypothetical protein SeMB42_g05724 [Synchytrium endobioticum]
MAALTKPKQFDITDTNIAGIGTDLEKNVRLGATQTEEAWHGVGQKPETKVWRVEQFKVAPWPEQEYGIFYDGDSYIVLHTWKKPDAPTLYHDIYFWLGLHTTQDEAGTAAYKSVELDDWTLPVQHREVQGSESPAFLALFRIFRVDKGGITSGFRHVAPDTYRPRLMHIRQNKSAPRAAGLVIREVPLSHTSLNSGDVFVYDAGTAIYQWNGANSSGIEKNKTAEFVRSLADSRGGKAPVKVYDEGDADAKPFWDGIGGQGPVAAADSVNDASAAAPAKSLWRLSDASGQLQFTREAQGVINRTLFDSSDVYVLDVGSEVFVWVGKKASADERKKAMMYALEYMKSHDRSMTSPVTRIVQGGADDVMASYLDH